MSVRFLVIDVLVAGLFDEYILHPVESWLRMGEMDGAEATVEVEVEAIGNVRGRSLNDIVMVN